MSAIVAGFRVIFSFGVSVRICSFREGCSLCTTDPTLTLARVLILAPTRFEGRWARHPCFLDLNCAKLVSSGLWHCGFSLPGSDGSVGLETS